MASMQQSVERLPDGTIGLRLVDRERRILHALVDDLRTIIGEAPPPPGLTSWDDDDPQAPAGDDPVDGMDAAPDAPADAIESLPEDSDEPALVDPVTIRLYPDARPDDVAWSRRFRDMIRGDLDDGRREAMGIVADTIDVRTIDDAQAEAWLHVLNDLRLVMGTRLDVTEDSEQRALDAEDPAAAAMVVYAYVGWLEAQFVDVLAGALPDVPPDDPADDRPSTDDRASTDEDPASSDAPDATSRD
jgi:hypothetical protein